MYHPAFRPVSLSLRLPRVQLPRCTCISLRRSSHHIQRHYRISSRDRQEPWVRGLPFTSALQNGTKHQTVVSSFAGYRTISTNREVSSEKGGRLFHQPRVSLGHVHTQRYVLPFSSPTWVERAPQGLLQSPASGPSLRCQVRHSSTEPTTLYESVLNSQPVHYAESVFQFGHSLTGLPWWASIALTTFTLRLVLTLPLAVYSQNIRARVENLQPEVIALAKRAFVQRFAPRAKQEQWSEKRAQRAFVGLVRRYSRELYVRDNCHPAKGSILFLVQLPMWILLSLSLRNMTGAFAERMYVDPASIVPELASGGTLWFASLTVPDPTGILPVLVGILNLANIEMHALHKGRVTRVQRYVNNTLRGISLIMIPVAAYVPAAMTLYWTVSASYGLGQNILLKIPSARRALGARPSKSDSSTPFQDMRDEFVVRYLSRTGRGQTSDGRLEEMADNGDDSKSKKKPNL
ncbi:cytochrome c oxidase assembly protein COX18, mitochondrial-like [Diadema setosum]|uniref:cytochrome c oxidase assembly protein COX18, mitochondrial-like n=1 Tax=Diadema setosum TaxID=31175 RepID=UPI003B3AD021